MPNYQEHFITSRIINFNKPKTTHMKTNTQTQSALIIMMGAMIAVIAIYTIASGLIQVFEKAGF